MTFEFTTIGNSSAIPAYDRFPSAHLINYNETYFLLDCAEGTQIKMQELGLKKSKIRHIFISHLHGDHFFGLFGLLTSLNLLGHEKSMTLYTFPELEEVLDLLLKFSGLKFRFPLKIVPLKDDHVNLILEDDYLKVYSIPLEHRIPCCGFLFEEKEKKRTFLPENIERYNIPVEQIEGIKSGDDFETEGGKVIPNEKLTLPADPPRKFAYITDTLHLPALKEDLHGVDTLYHEATFVHEAVDRAKKTFHSTARQAGELAAASRVEKLLLGHFSAKYKDLSSLLNEARDQFPESYLTESGKTFEI